MDVNTRQDAFERAQRLTESGATIEQTLRTADWLLTGALPIDPTRVDEAAHSLARSRGLVWAGMSPADKNTLRGEAIQTVTAYLRAS